MTHQTTPPLAGEIEGIRRRVRSYPGQAKKDCATLLAALDAADELNARLKLEAQGHAQEARTANATVHEIYQVISGATGEPGNWNGAEPVKTYVAKAQERFSGLEGALKPFAEVLPKDTNTQRDYFPADIGMMNGNVCQKVFSGLKVRHFWDAAHALPSPGTKGEVG